MCIRNSQKLNTPRSNIFNKWILILYKIIDPVGDEAFEDFLGALRACTLIVIFYIGIWVLYPNPEIGMQ